MPSSRGSSWPRDQTQVSCTAGRFFTIWATREALEGLILVFYPQAGVGLRVERILQRQVWPRSSYLTWPGLWVEADRPTWWGAHLPPPRGLSAVVQEIWVHLTLPGHVGGIFPLDDSPAGVLDYETVHLFQVCGPRAPSRLKNSLTPGSPFTRWPPPCLSSASFWSMVVQHGNLGGGFCLTSEVCPECNESSSVLF